MVHGSVLQLASGAKSETLPPSQGSKQGRMQPDSAAWPCVAAFAMREARLDVLLVYAPSLLSLEAGPSPAHPCCLANAWLMPRGALSSNASGSTFRISSGRRGPTPAVARALCKNRDSQAVARQAHTCWLDRKVLKVLGNGTGVPAAAPDIRDRPDLSTRVGDRGSALHVDLDRPILNRIDRG